MATGLVAAANMKKFYGLMIRAETDGAACCRALAIGQSCRVA
jgi:hypothetical protein